MSAIFNTRESKIKQLGLVVIGLTLGAALIFGPAMAAALTDEERWFAIYGLYGLCAGLYALYKGVSDHQ